jgi:hypothetical protein
MLRQLPPPDPDRAALKDPLDRCQDADLTRSRNCFKDATRAVTHEEGASCPELPGERRQLTAGRA